MKRETENVLIFSWTIVGMIALVVIVVSLGQRAEAREGFYLMIGAGENHSAWNDEHAWVDNGEIGCGFGFGYMTDLSSSTVLDFAFRHKSQCMSGPPVNDENEAGAEFYYLDLYWFPFK